MSAFPDLEYYFLYPHFEAGALLVLDDIHIRSINNLFQFLRRDEMFWLDEVERNTAFSPELTLPPSTRQGLVAGAEI